MNRIFLPMLIFFSITSPYLMSPAQLKALTPSEEAYIRSKQESIAKSEIKHQDTEKRQRAASRVLKFTKYFLEKVPLADVTKALTKALEKE